VSEGGARLRYQPALDGLRAVAVLAVIAYHDGYDWVRGGFLGVDAFFVLSGFLITTLLLLEYQRIATIGLVAFWGRRIRRLLPALLLVLLAVALYAAADVSSFQLDSVRSDALSSLFYVTNWRFIASDSSYFQFVASPSPVQHLWSLAIEEQFYLVWPLVVLACLRLGRGKRRYLVGVAVVGAIVSTVVMAGLYDGTDPSRAYYGTDARVHTILVGALLAVWLVVRPPSSAVARRAVLGAGVVGAVAMVWAIHALSDTSPGYYHGGSVLYAVAVAAVIGAVMQPVASPLRWSLGLAPLVFVGRISYGLYLWHWPVNLVVTEQRVGVDGAQLDLVRLLVTFAFATASFYAIEMPIRRGVLRARPAQWLAPAAVLATGVSLFAATAGAEAVPSYLGGQGGGDASPIKVQTEAPPTTTTTAAPPGTRLADAIANDVATAQTRSAIGPGGRTNIAISACPEPRADEIEAARDAARNFGPPPPMPPGGPVRVLVVGDSLACSVNVGLEPAAGPDVVTKQIAMVGCGVVSDEVYDAKEPYPMLTEHCNRIVQGRLYSALQSFRPAVVLWVSSWERMPTVEQDKVFVPGSIAWRAVLRGRMDAVYARIRAAGARVVITTVAPPAPAGMLNGGRIVSPEFDYRFGILNDEIRQFAARHQEGVSLVDLDRRLCPDGPQCPAGVDGIEPRHDDGSHFPPVGSAWLTHWMLPTLLGPPGITIP
jgi:peptidoglycan/LPS O-acetylase OafA/YrhL